MSTTDPATKPFEERLLDELLEVHARRTQPALAAPRRARRRRPLVAVGAAAAVAMAAALVVQTLPGGVGRPDPAAAAELHHLAAAAATRHGASRLAPGQYQYTSSVGLFSSTYADGKTSFTVLLHEHRQIWIATNGSGRLIQRDTDPVFPTPQDRATWIAKGRPALTSPSGGDMTFGPGGLSLGPVDLWTLPTDPARLGAMISSRQIESGPSGPAEDFVQVGDLLRETDAPSALRVALFDVASTLPGVKLLGTTTLPTGQSGIALATLTDGPAGTQVRHELIFDPTTTALVGEQDVQIDTATGATNVIGWTTYLASQIVDSTSTTS